MALTDLLKTFSQEKVIVKDDKGRYIEKTAKGVSLKGVLQRGRLRIRKERSLYPQGLGFRPSSITYTYCRRLKVAQLAGLVEIYDDKPTPKLQLVFDFGHAIHDIIQGYFWDIGILKGSYYCIKCDKVYHDLVSPDRCPSNTKSHTKQQMRYREVQATNETYRIKGRCDGILVIDNEEHIMDIKSIANRTLKTNEIQFCFEDLEDKGPKPEHVVQLNLYMWMLNIHNGHLLYVSKNDHQIRTFSVPFDYEVIKPYLEEIEELITQAQALMEGRPVKLPPACGSEKCVCHTILSKAPST